MKKNLQVQAICLLASMLLLNGCLSTSQRVSNREVAQEPSSQPKIDVSEETPAVVFPVTKSQSTKTTDRPVVENKKKESAIIAPATKVSGPAQRSSVTIKHDASKRPIIGNKIVLKQGDKVFFVGDSLMQGVAPHVRKELNAKYNIQGIDLSKQSSGLRNLNFYNWPKVIEETFTQNPNIKLMVVYLGANDPWGFSNMSFKSNGWEKAYRARITQIIKTAQAHGARVLWLGVPDMREKELHESIVYLNGLYRSEVQKNGEIYQSSREVIGSKGDQFVSVIEKDGNNVQIRARDGVHFTVAGQKLMSDTVLDYIQVR